jgi:hypothetical protein
MHHNDKDGVQIGRIKAVEYVEETRAKSPGLLFTCNIGDDAGIKGVKNGTLSTVSLGAVIHKATCSICGQNIATEGECEHQRGRRYEGKLCYWNMEEMEPKELSYVIVPSDRYANTIRIYKPKDLGAKESYNEGGNEESMGIFDNIDLTLTKPEAKPEVQESVEEQVVEEVVEVQEAEQQQEQEEAKVEEVVVEEEPKVEVEEEPKQEPEKEEEVKEEEPKEKGIDDMSKEELADKCKELIKLVAGLQDDVKYLRNKLNE